MEEAIACFDRALEIRSGFADAWLGKGAALWALGRKEEAIACFDRALESDPRFAAAWDEKGVGLSRLDAPGRGHRLL